jgi:hypothetical protein
MGPFTILRGMTPSAFNAAVRRTASFLARTLFFRFFLALASRAWSTAITSIIWLHVNIPDST